MNKREIEVMMKVQEKGIKKSVIYSIREKIKGFETIDEAIAYLDWQIRNLENEYR